MDCSEAANLIPGYVLDALTDDERATLQVHLDTGCTHCQREVRELNSAASLLAENLEPARPPAELRTALLDRIATESQSGEASITLPPSRSEPSSSSPATWKTYFGYAAVALVGVAIGSLVANTAQLGTFFDGSDQDSARMAQQWQQNLEAAEQAFGSPDAQLIGFDGVESEQRFQAAVMFDRVAHQLHVITSRVPPPPAGRTLWLWLLDKDGEVLSGSPLKAIGRERAATVIDLPELPANIHEAVISFEEQDDLNEPSGPIVERALLKQNR